MYDAMRWAETRDTLAGADAGAADDAALLDVARELAALASVVQLAQARVLAELERRQVCDRDLGMTTGGWLAHTAHLPPALCRAQVSTATALTHLPAVTDAVAAGTVTFEHAKVIAAARPGLRDDIIERQHDLLERAQGVGFDRWKAEVRGIFDELDRARDRDPNEDLARNRLQLREDLDGVLHLHGEAVGEHALGLCQLIDAKADELFRRYRDDNKHDPDLVVPNRATLRLLALAELCRQGSATDLHTSKPPRPEVMLVINTDEPAAVYDPVGRRLPPEATATLLCDSQFYAVVVDKLGVPFDMGRTVRLATSHQRKALAALYGGCAFPGCDCTPQWTDIHHGDDWIAKTGHTNFSRLVPLCRRHHGITHRRGWSLHIDPDGWAWWQTPTGHTFWSQRHQRQRPHPPPQPVPSPVTTPCGAKAAA